MTRFLILCAVLLIAFVPARAQTEAFEPAAHIPADAPVFVEVLLTDALDSVLTPLGFAPNAFATLTTYFLDDPAAAAAIRAFTHDRAGMVMNEGRYTLLVLGVTDPEAARAYLDAQPFSDSIITLTDDVLYLGEPDAVAAAQRAGGRMNVNPAYARVLRALPDDATLRAYVSPAELDRVLFADTLFPLAQDLLRLNPAQSTAELGLLAAAGIDGLGITATQNDEGTINMRAALKIDAIYDTPVVPPFTLGLYIPAEAGAWFMAHDAAVIAIPTTLLLDNPTALLMQPISALTVEPVQSSVALAETFIGATLAELYPLINGEYAAAVIVSDDRAVLPLFWLRTSDADRVLEHIENTSARLWIDTDGTRLFNITRAPIDGFDAITLTDFPDDGLRPVIIRLADDVIAVTTAAALDRVIAGAADSFSVDASDHAATFALNGALGLFNGAITGALDLQADGLIVLDVLLAP